MFRFPSGKNYFSLENDQGALLFPSFSVNVFKTVVTVYSNIHRESSHTADKEVYVRLFWTYVIAQHQETMGQAVQSQGAPLQ